jgi:hypothetical protein
MFKNLHHRRALSISLIVLGGVLIFLAPGNVWIGTVIGVLGIAIELIAFGLGHAGRDKK